MFAKGWTSPAVLILKTVVDPSISSLSVAMFLFQTNVVNSIAAVILGYLTNHFKIGDPLNHPKEYGDLVTYMTVVPCALSVPFFLISGFKMRSIQRKKVALGEQTKQGMEQDNQFVKQFTVFDNGFEVMVLNPYPQMQRETHFFNLRKTKSLYVGANRQRVSSLAASKPGMTEHRSTFLTGTVAEGPRKTLMSE